MLANLFAHYVITDFYDPVWPNIAASAVLFVAMLAKFRALEKLHKLHHQEAMQLAKAHHAELTGGAGPRSVQDPQTPTAGP